MINFKKNTRKLSGQISILLITEDCVPMVGGVATFLHNICLYSKARLSVLALNVKGGGIDGETPPYPIVRINLPKHLDVVTLFFILLYEVITKKPDVIFWGDYNKLIAVSHLFKTLLHVRVAVLIHGMRLNSSLMVHSLSRFMVHCNLERCDLILANSHYTRNRILCLGKKIASHKVRVLYPGVDVRKFYPMTRCNAIADEYGLFGKKIILTIARLVKKKNHEGVLRIMPDVIKHVPNLMYLIVGGGEERDALYGLAGKLGIEKHVLFIESSSLKRCQLLYNTCDVFIMPNKMSYVYVNRNMAESVETFGMVFCEANACGKPVVGGNNGGVPESIVHGETGLLVDPDNETEMKNALLKLLLDPALAKRMGAKGRIRVEREFSWERVVDEFDRQMESILLNYEFVF